MFQKIHRLSWCLLAVASLMTAGCSGLLHRSAKGHSDGCTTAGCQTGGCETGGCSHDGCSSCGTRKKWYKLGKKDKCADGCETCNDCSQKTIGKCKSCGTGGCCLTNGCCGSCLASRSLAIPDIYPVGAVMRAHFHQMQTNAEAADFIFYQKDFVLESAELTPDGKDKIFEIAARMRSAPFPVIVERTWNNANPELDAHRRAIISQILTDLGNTDANNRTFVSNSYGLGKNGIEAIPEYYQYVFQGGNFNNFGNGGGGFGGGGGGGGGGF